MNSVNLIGRLVRDPELRYLPNGGRAVVRFTLAVDKQLSKDKKQDMENKGQPTADFIGITVWGKQAESSANHLSKGKRVAVQGRIQTGSYVNKEGDKVYTTDVVAERVHFIDWNDSNQGSGGSSEYGGFDIADDVGEDSIPF